MSDDLNDETQDNEEEEESFAELLESYSFGMKDDLQIGDKITAKLYVYIIDLMHLTCLFWVI